MDLYKGVIMFAIKFCCDLVHHQWDYKIFDTVGEALQWWRNHIGSGGTPFVDMLFVLPPGLANPLAWCYANIK